MSVKKTKKLIKNYVFILITVLLSIYFFNFFYQIFKPLPEGISYEGEMHFIEEKDIDFLYDLTYQDFEDNKVSKQEIFDKIFKVINDSDRFLLADYFLFNSDYSESVKFRGL